ncbi:hypothetical protein ADUPG1_003179, partial [Aduncisulcus paluster]
MVLKERGVSGFVLCISSEVKRLIVPIQGSYSPSLPLSNAQDFD